MLREDKPKTRISKHNVLKQMENEYRKVDPDFKITNYVSEHEDQVEKHKNKIFYKKGRPSMY
jgi:hypothetical protein